jgi:hypothetical protein
MREMIRIRISLPFVTLATAWNMARISTSANVGGFRVRQRCGIRARGCHRRLCVHDSQGNAGSDRSSNHDENSHVIVGRFCPDHRWPGLR